MMPATSRILCATDFSTTSDEALRYAVELAKQNHARLTIVHVRIPRQTNAAIPSQDSQAENLTDWLGNTTASAAGVRCEHLYRDGDPADEIVTAAREMHVRQIVLGTHGRRGFRRNTMGSTAEEVVQRAPCAVTVVNNQDVER